MGASELPSLHKKPVSWLQMGSLGLGFRRPHRLLWGPTGQVKALSWRRWSSASKAVPEPHSDLQRAWGTDLPWVGHIPSSHVFGRASGGLAGTPRAPRHTGTTLLTSCKWWCPSVGIAEASGNKYPLWHLKKRCQVLRIKRLTFNLFIYFGCVGSLFHTQAFSSCGWQGGATLAGRVCRLLISVTSLFQRTGSRHLGVSSCGLFDL